MAIPWSGIGNVIGGVGGLLSGTSSLFGNKGQSTNDYGQGIDEYWYRTMRQAGYYGIHPLAAIGVRPGSGPVARSSNNMPEALDRMGQGIRRMLQAGESKVQQAQARLLNAQADAIEREKTPEGQRPGWAGQTQITEEDIPYPNKTGYSKVIPMEVLAMDNKGLLHPFPAEEVQDYLSESLVAKMEYEAKKNFNRLDVAFRTKNWNKLRDELDELERTFPPGKNYYYLWNVHEGLPQRVRYRGGKKYLTNAELPGHNWPSRYSHR